MARYDITSGVTSTGKYLNYDIMYVSSGGTADSTTVYGGGGLYVSFGGIANSTMVDNRGSMYVSSGGTANSTTVNSYGSMHVYSGGVANDTTLINLGGYPGGFLFVFSGGTANSTTVNSYGSMQVSSGGTANSTTVNSFGYMTVFSGGTANSTMVNPGGSMYVYSGGTATIVYNPWLGHISFTDSADVTYLAPDANIYIGNRTSGILSKYDALENYVISSWNAVVMTGGTANSTTINSGGMYVSGGTANNTTVNPEGNMNVSSGGTANNTTVNGHGRLYVYSGGTADNTTLSGGGLNISGGTANSTTVNPGGYMYVSGGTADNTTISGGSMHVSSGGTANNTTISSGSMYVSSGGTANSTTVNGHGMLYVYSGGTAMKVAENGGYVNVWDGAHVTFVSNSFSGLVLTGSSATIHSGTTANSTTVNSGGRLYVFSGGTATNIVWTPCVGNISSAEGAYVTYASQYSGVYYGADDQLLSSAKVMESKTVSGNNERMYVMSGGTAKDTSVVNCSMFVMSGGTANNTAVHGENAFGYIYVSNGGIANSTLLFVGVLGVLSGGTANGTGVGNGNVYVSGGGTANGTILYNQSCTLHVLDGGTANDAIVSSGAVMYVLSGGTANNATVNIGGTMHVSSGGTATIMFNPWQGSIISSAGAKVSYLERDTGVYYGGKNSGLLYKGNALYLQTIESGNSTNVYDGGTMDNTTVAVGGELHVSGGTANRTAIIGGGLYVYSGGTVNSTAISSGGSAVLSGGNLNSTTVYANARLTVSSGGVAKDMKMYAGGSLTLAKGGTITGKMSILAGTILQVENGAVINFDLTQTSAGERPLLNDLSLVQGTPDYTITVDGNQQSGTYNLADAAYDFDGSVVIMNSLGTKVGTLTVGQTVKINDADYTLNLGSDGLLSVTVGEPAPGPSPQTDFITKSDIDGNGVSDVMFQWTGGNYQIGFWMNGQPDWQSQGRGRSSEWNILGAHDMNGDGKADTVMTGESMFIDMKGTYIGYYSDGVDVDANWHTIGFLLDSGSGVAWRNTVGNLTGNENMNSIVWYAPELYALGVWKDGREDWTTLSGNFGGEGWAMAGCGDFDGDGKDSVLMSGSDGKFLYSVGLDGVAHSHGAADWSGWDVCAIGDFAGDGKDDIVLIHSTLGALAMLVDGNADNYVSLGQIDAKDWFVVGAGDYNGDKKDDLLVRQYSTGMLGCYSTGDLDQWVEMGRGVDMNWTVIA